MAIVQRIEFKSPNKYFAGFLQNAINSSGVKGSVEFKSRTITLVLDGDIKSISKFANFIQKYLPYSIFLEDIDTFEDDIPHTKNKKFESPPYPIAPCPICLEELSYPGSSRYLDDTISCNHYSNSQIYIDNDYTIFSPHYNRNNTLLLTNSSKLNSLFYINENETKALFSIEKPSLLLTIKDEKLKNLIGKKFMRVKAPYNIRSALIAINAKDSQIDTLFFNERDIEPKAIVVQNYLCMIYDNKLSTPLKNLHSEQSINRFLNIKAEANYNEAIGVYLSQKAITFIVSNIHITKEVMNLGKFNIKDVLKQMRDNPHRIKLLERFEQTYPDSFNCLKSENIDIFETLSIIIGLDEVGFEALNLASLEFRGDGGLKIDMNFSNSRFDYTSTVGSIMSFKLAGVDKNHLAYSIFEAYGDMVISVLNQLKRKFDIENFILFGDIFSSNVLFSRVLSKFTISKPYFSRAIALDIGFKTTL